MAPRRYRAVRLEGSTWSLEVDGAAVSTHSGYRDAVRAAEADDLRRRRLGAVLLRVSLIAAAGLLLIPVMVWREIPNDAYPPAREFADRMEAAYRDVDAGRVDIGSFTVDEDGFVGDLRTLDRGGVVADYRLLIGEHDGDCYLIRWVRFEVPFVARLLPRYECAPGSPPYNPSPSAYEAIAVNLTNQPPLNWVPVLPDEQALAGWFFPAVIVLLAGIIQQLVSLSLVFLKGPRPRPVRVERVEPG
jgi:hypothetical protein